MAGLAGGRALTADCHVAAAAPAARQRALLAKDRAMALQQLNEVASRMEGPSGLPKQLLSI